MSLCARGITKRFGAVQALEDVNIDLEPGQIHALAGENGAGKSTLVKVLTGVLQPDAGEVLLGGQRVEWAGPVAAKRAGVRVIFQEFALFGEMTVAENIFIAHEEQRFLSRSSRSVQERKARQLIGRLGLDIEPAAKVSRLSVADQQMVEICRALSSDARILILDEPTAVISGREVDLLFQCLETLKAADVAILFISHRLDEILDHCDVVTVLKDGRYMGTEQVADIDQEVLVARMVGRSIQDLYPAKREVQRSGVPVLRTEDLSAGAKLKGASVEVFAGEVIGMAGMVGSGRTEFARTVFGIDQKSGGRIYLEGREVKTMTPSIAVAAGVGFLTEDRKAEGLLLNLDIAANIVAPCVDQVTQWSLIDRAAERTIAAGEITKFAIAAQGPGTMVQALSGGNQQKVLLARWARISRRLLILDEPTRGVDIGAKVEIYRIIRQIASEGTSIIVISSELPEVIGLCERVYVMREGHVVGELENDEITETKILRLSSQVAEASAGHG